MKVKVGYAKNLRVWSGWVGYGLVFGQSSKGSLNMKALHSAKLRLSNWERR